jgi:hypothetical protein
MTTMISSGRGGSGGYCIPLLRGARPARCPGIVTGERRRPAASTRTIESEDMTSPFVRIGVPANPGRTRVNPQPVDVMRPVRLIDPLPLRQAVDTEQKRPSGSPPPRRDRWFVDGEVSGGRRDLLDPSRGGPKSTFLNCAKSSSNRSSELATNASSRPPRGQLCGAATRISFGATRSRGRNKQPISPSIDLIAMKQSARQRQRTCQWHRQGSAALDDHRSHPSPLGPCASLNAPHGHCETLRRELSS